MGCCAGRGWSRVIGSLAACLCFALVVAAGCSEPETKEDEAAAGRNIGNLARFYGRFIASNRGMIPPSEDALKKFLASEPIASEVQGTGITDVNTLFVSPRDKQPYVVTYKTPPRNPGLQGDPIIAYEAVGVDGKRWVASMAGTYQELDAEQFKAAVPDAK